MSLEWQPQIVKIESVVHHPDADALDIATVLGDYPVIVKRGEYKPGELAAYIPIDSIVQDTDQFYFLCPKAYEKYEEDGEIKQRQVGPKYPVGSVPEKYRIIRAKKIRDVYSQGMIVDCPPSFNEGDSIVDLFNLTKCIEEEEDNITSPKFVRADQESPPKGWTIPYYDIESLRKSSELFNDKEVVLYEKLHGSNAGFCHDGEKLWAKSRNFYKKMDPDDMWWDIAIRYDLESKLYKYPKMVMFGEIYGQVKGFRYDCPLENGQLLPKIRFFDIWDTTTMKWVDDSQLNEIINDLGLDMVPCLYRGKWLGKEEMYKFAEGNSTLNSKHIREGFVIRPTLESKDHMFNRLIRKLVGEGYNLQK